MEFAQICDRAEFDIATAGPVDSSPLVGTWINSNPDTNGIARLIITGSNADLSVHAFAIGPDGIIDWGTTDGKVLASAVTSRLGAGFKCLFDFGFAETYLLGMIAKGLLVLAQFHSFKDGSGRMDYFVREYYALMPPP